MSETLPFNTDIIDSSHDSVDPYGVVVRLGVVLSAPRRAALFFSAASVPLVKFAELSLAHSFQKTVVE